MDGKEYMSSSYDATKVRRRLEPLTVRTQAHETGIIFDEAMKDMQGYIERQGGVLEQKTKDIYRFYVPILWTGKVWQRFRSFGIHARLLGDAVWSDELEIQSKV